MSRPKVKSLQRTGKEKGKVKKGNKNNENKLKLELR